MNRQNMNPKLTQIIPKLTERVSQESLGLHFATLSTKILCFLIIYGIYLHNVELSFW